LRIWPDPALAVLRAFLSSRIIIGAAARQRKDVREADVTGLKHFDKLAPLSARLHDVGRRRGKAGNRNLHCDQYCTLVLLFLFNPAVVSPRGIQQASQLRNVQRKLGCPRASFRPKRDSAHGYARHEPLQRLLQVASVRTGRANSSLVLMRQRRFLSGCEFWQTVQIPKSR